MTRYITAQAAAEYPRYLTVKAAAAYMSVCSKTVREWIGSGFLKPVELPTINGQSANRFIRIDRHDLDSVLQKRKTGG